MSGTWRRVAVAVCSLVMAGCAGEADVNGEPTEAAGAATANPERSRVMDEIAGTWNLVAYNPAGDSIAVSSFIAGPDPSSWRTIFPATGETVPMRMISAEADSVVAEAGPYTSVLQPGVTVLSNRVVIRINGDQLTGSWQTRRSVTGADSVLQGTLRGTREPQRP